EVVDAEQEQAEPAQEGHGGGGVHGRSSCRRAHSRSIRSERASISCGEGFRFLAAEVLREVDLRRAWSGVSGGREPAMIEAANPGSASEATAWHAIAADDVVQRLGGNTQTGLDPAEARARLARYGPNRLPEAAKQGPLMRLLLQFNNV